MWLRSPSSVNASPEERGTPTLLQFEVMVQLHAVRLDIPANANVIVGTSHFIKTVEDIYEALVNTVPQMKFGIAFSEASGPCLIRTDGNDRRAQASATAMAEAVAAGHSFYVVMRMAIRSMCSGGSKTFRKSAPSTARRRIR